MNIETKTEDPKQNASTHSFTAEKSHPLPSGSRNLHVHPHSCAYGDSTQRNKGPTKHTCPLSVAPPYLGAPPPGDTQSSLCVVCVTSKVRTHLSNCRRMTRASITHVTKEFFHRSTI
ncbi:unnamed protein product [Ectocarpus sp. 4 AP-2014]